MNQYKSESMSKLFGICLYFKRRKSWLDRIFFFMCCEDHMIK